MYEFRFDDGLAVSFQRCRVPPCVTISYGALPIRMIDHNTIDVTCPDGTGFWIGLVNPARVDVVVNGTDVSSDAFGVPAPGGGMAVFTAAHAAVTINSLEVRVTSGPAEPLDDADTYTGWRVP